MRELVKQFSTSGATGSASLLLQAARAALRRLKLRTTPNNEIAGHVVHCRDGSAPGKKVDGRPTRGPDRFDIYVPERTTTAGQAVVVGLRVEGGSRIGRLDKELSIYRLPPERLPNKLFCRAQVTAQIDRRHTPRMR
jgi:hypothetical protein